MRSFRVPSLLARLWFIVSLALLGAGSAHAQAPVIQWLVSTPSSIPAGGGTTLRWHVDGADTISIDHGIGAVAALGSIAVAPATTTTYTLTASKAGVQATKTHTLVVTANANASGNRFVNMVSPVSGQHFTAPGNIRVFAAAFDPDGINCNGDQSGDGGDRCPSRVDFYVDDTVMASEPGLQAEYWVFKSAISGIPAGTHRIWARAIYTSPPAGALDSEPMWITVDPPPVYAQTIDLAQDVTLNGNQNYEFIGAPNGRIRINANGHRISSSGNWTGRLTLKYVDMFNSGAIGDTGTTIDVSTTNAVTIEDSIFETISTIALDLNGAATASIRRNEFRSNMVMQEAQQPEFGVDASYPAIRITGGARAQKFFQGNSIGIGWADFQNADNWMIGGGDADSNVVIAPRGGIWARNMTRTTIRGNLIYHVYYGGWSQGNVMELDGSNDIVVEHNMVGGGSWPIRGFGGTLRYNLIIDAGHEWLWITDSNASVHHNVFVGGDADVAGIFMIYKPKNVDFHNNTVDGLNKQGVFPFQVGTNSTVSMHSNAFVNMRDPPTIDIEKGDGTIDPDDGTVLVDGVANADYNLFFGQQGTPHNYSDNRKPTHDVGALNAQVNPKFTEPSEPWRYGWEDIWGRRIHVTQVLANYRTRYTPAAGSPLIDAGDPASAAGNDIGAVGSGTPAADDLFGLLAAGPPPDITPPTGTVQINGGAAKTNVTAVTLALTAADNASGVAAMRFSNDGVNFSASIPFAATASWTLSNGDGMKTVSAEFQDGAGNWSTPVTATIQLDTASAAQSLTGVQSRKTHGAAGTYDLPIDHSVAIAGAVTVEPRAIGTGHQLVFQFDGVISNAGTAAVVDQNLAPIGAASVPVIGGASNNEVSVTLTGIPDLTRVTVSLTGVNGAIDSTVSLGFLVGDVNNTRSVNSSDISGVKARSGLATDATNFKFDVNASGAINASDISAVKARSGRGV